MSESLERSAIAPATPENEDGRRRRSERSREQIIEAMFAVVREGDLDPSAARIAEYANVSLRTVFRHFDEVDALYAEMNRRVKAEVMPIIQQPLAAQTWEERIRELLIRRADVFERILPFRVCGSLRRFRSAFLMQGHEEFVALERAIMDSHLPDHVRKNAELESAFDIAMGFDTWRRLRQDQKLSPEEARAVVRRLVDALIAVS